MYARRDFLRLAGSGIATSVFGGCLLAEDNNQKKPNVLFIMSDDCDEEVEVSLVGITSSEQDDGRGDGRTKNDIIIGDDGSIYLRAERTGSSAGRVYTITYEAVDDSGNATEASAEVLVPDGYRWRHRERKGRERIRHRKIDTRQKRSKRVDG
ncbi:MAG: hypothetical protein JSW23_02990 [Planctomycetota bacterium]|nr:MAG: hypothetical protein JSW23_02990 [Planctomycetota bacterium]